MTDDSPPSPATHGVTLLPRHWTWLTAQPRSASATLRQLVEAASRDPQGHHAQREARDRCYDHLRDHAGDRPGFEEAVRALYARQPAAFDAHTSGWPEAVRAEARRLATLAWMRPGTVT